MKNFLSGTLALTLLGSISALAQTTLPRSTPPYIGSSRATLRDPGLGGQGANPGGTEPFSTLSPSPVTSPISPSPSAVEAMSGFERWRGTNAIGKTLRELNKDGVTVRADYIENLARNPAGGERQGSAASQWVDIGADFDLQKLVGWEGAIMHLQGAWFWGRSVGRDYIGNSISFQQTWRAVPGPRLTVFDLEQILLDDKLNLLVGRAAVNSFFATSPLNCNFMSNTSCLALYGPITDIGITAFPNSSWAGKARYAFTKNVYVQLGAFEYDNVLNTEGRDGLDFGTSGATGYILPGEVGYETSFADDLYPRRYRVGFYRNSAGAQDPYFDAKDSSAALAHLPRVTYAGGRTGLYGLVDQTVWRLRPNTEDNLALFGRIFYNEGNPYVVDWFASGGFVLTGPSADRHEDTIDFLITDTHFSAREIENLTALRKRAGGTGGPRPDEIIGEINYGYQLVPGIRILPNLQWVVNPDPINAPHSKRNIPDAIVLGLKLDVHFAEVFGGR